MEPSKTSWGLRTMNDFHPSRQRSTSISLKASRKSPQNVHHGERRYLSRFYHFPRSAFFSPPFFSCRDCCCVFVSDDVVALSNLHTYSLFTVLLRWHASTLHSSSNEKWCFPLNSKRHERALASLSSAQTIRLQLLFFDMYPRFFFLSFHSRSTQLFSLIDEFSECAT